MAVSKNTRLLAWIFSGQAPKNPILVLAEDVCLREEMIFTETRWGVGCKGLSEANLFVSSISESICPIAGEEGERTGMAYHILLGKEQQLKCEAITG